jgi:hypothetical protein
MFLIRRWSLIVPDQAHKIFPTLEFKPVSRDKSYLRNDIVEATNEKGEIV